MNDSLPRGILVLGGCLLAGLIGLGWLLGKVRVVSTVEYYLAD